jgi:NADH-quinone oxidoreductase subunit F
MSDAPHAAAGNGEQSAQERPLTGAFRADGRPLTLADYERSGGYAALRHAITAMAPQDVTTTVTNSKLRGRGGAGYGTGNKWSFMPLGDETPGAKYIACNADEMEPGCFKDRILMERNPHLLLEGVLLAGYATQATAGYIFVRDNYDVPYAHLETAIEEARAAGYVGARVMDGGWGFEIFLHQSGGRYICGEASAMLDAIEGGRAIPRTRPPHMTGAGLWARPTVVNNVETFCCVPGIITHGADWYVGLGRSEEGGTKLCTVAGRVRRPGWYELPMGTPMRELIEEHAGGMTPGYELVAVIPGGASSAFVMAKDLDVPLDFGSVEKVGSRLGTATLVVVDQTICPVALLANLELFFAQESCGWCTPCRDGLPWVLATLQAIEAGHGQMSDLDLLEELCWAMGPERAFCDHAPGAAQPLASGLVHFRDVFEQHIREGGCPYHGGGATTAAAAADSPAGSPQGDS